MFDSSYDDRNHKLAKAIISHYSYTFFYGKKILDLGAGQGGIAAALARLGADVLCVDARGENITTINKLHPHLKTLRCDIDNEWPFAGQHFDMVLSLGLLCHIDNYDKHLNDICGVAEHVVLETEVLDTADIDWKMKFFEDAAINDLSFTGKACVVSAQNIQNRLSAISATYKRKDDPNRNSDNIRYNWVENNIGKQVGNRRMWFIRRDPHLVKIAANNEQIQKAENVIIENNNVRQLNAAAIPTHAPTYSIAANRAAINTSMLQRKAANNARYNKGTSLFYGKPVFNHNSTPTPTLPQTKIRLFFNYYEDKNPERQKEIDYCLQKNIDNNLLDIIILESEKTPTYNFYFEKINQLTRPDDINIIANSDIFFDSSIGLVSQMQPKEAYVLSRWDWYGEGSIAKHRAIKNSQDVWIIKGKAENIDGSFCLGVPFCDNRIAFELSRAGYKVSNPSRSIKTYHFHNSGVRKYRDDERVNGQYLFVEPTSL